MYDGAVVEQFESLVVLVSAFLQTFGGIGEYLLAVVAGVVAVAVGEFVLDDGTVVRAARTRLLFRLELLDGEEVVQGERLADGLLWL